MTAKVILNPYAARWQASKRWPEAQAALLEAGVNFEVEQSKEPGHAIFLTLNAIRQGFNPIIAAGGDGTIGEVVNGIMTAGEEQARATFGIMPLGTANDLVDNLGMPKELDKAAQVIAANQIREIDVCQVNDRFFINNAGIGLEPYITNLQQNMTRTSGIIRYLLATLKGVAHNPQWRMKLQWDDGEYDGPVTLVSIGNAPRTGGIFFTVPAADPFDGKLTFVFGYIAGRLNILRVLPQTMKAGEGNYVEHPAIHQHHGTWLKVSIVPNSPSHADGELFTHGIHELEFRIHPASLPIISTK
ncbi:MAG: diacylglycerol kinase family lipid kinase [Chloroflexi bacterium]|nr:MAG: diacylglycerol kinase family lipid kinase [Chloroflexota bacterium]MBL1196087.1 diacylglycerol kinase family lipid kinase [Chloroflexota bacterium]NOH13380.1 diacylglycerol kinase family lipid kinase [Chloroflexota bacterium]